MEINEHLTEKGKRDYELIQSALAKGDQRAFSELMNNYRDSLYFMMLKMTNDPIDAEDMTIEAFGKAFKNLKNYTPEFAFSTWLFKIASNNCIDFLRKKRKDLLSLDHNQGVNSDTNYSLDIQCTGPDPEERIITKQKHKVLRDIVEKIKPHYRTLIELRYFKEYSYEEIATELNLPLGTVKAQLFRARDLLYQILKDSNHHI
jgi:RNA polymerase sigma-70 factor (ECF subfamily)